MAQMKVGVSTPKVASGGTQPAAKGDFSVSQMNAMYAKGDPKMGQASDSAVKEYFKNGASLPLFEMSSGRSTEWRSAAFTLLARAAELGVKVDASASQLNVWASCVTPQERPTLERLAQAQGVQLPGMRKGDEVAKTKAAPTAAQAGEAQRKTATEQQTLAAHAAKKQDSLFGVVEQHDYSMLAERSDVQSLMKKDTLSAGDMKQLLKLAPAKEIESQLVSPWGPYADKLTPESIAVLEAENGGGKLGDFLDHLAKQLPPGTSLASAESKRIKTEAKTLPQTRPAPDLGVAAKKVLDGIGDVATPADMKALMKAGMSPVEIRDQLIADNGPLAGKLSHGALETLTRAVDQKPVKAEEHVKVLHQLVERVKSGKVPEAHGKLPIADALANPKGANPSLGRLLSAPAFKSLFDSLKNKPVGANEMQSLINAAGPKGLKDLGSGVVFGSGGMSEQLTHEGMSTFLSAVNTASGGATLPASPAAYGAQPSYTGPAATAQTPQQFLTDPSLSYLSGAATHGFGSVIANTLMSVVGSNLMGYGQNMYGYYPSTYPNYSMYSGVGAYGAGLYGGGGYAPSTYGYGAYAGAAQYGYNPYASVGQSLGQIAGAALGVGIASLFTGGGSWNMGYGYQASYPMNNYGYNMLSAGWGYGSSWM